MGSSPIPVVQDTVNINCVLESEFIHMEKYYLKKMSISLHVCEQGAAIFIMLTLLCDFLLSNVLLNRKDQQQS